jgi:cardiolipin synthase
VAFVGGINVIDDRLDIHHGRTELPRLDFAVQLRGPLVHSVDVNLRAIWSRAWLGREFDDALLDYVPLPRRLRRWWRQLWWGPERLPRQAPPTPVCAAFVMRDNLRRRRTIEHAYVDIRGARGGWTWSALLLPRPAACAAPGADRGVRVRLLLQGKVDYRLAGWAAEALYAELMAHGVQIHEYTPAFLHAKVAVVDGRWATVGSSNIDPLSLLVNLEANVVVHDQAFVAHLAARSRRRWPSRAASSARAARPARHAAPRRRGLVRLCVPAGRRRRGPLLSRAVQEVLAGTRRAQLASSWLASGNSA